MVMAVLVHVTIYVMHVNDGFRKKNQFVKRYQFLCENNAPIHVVIVNQ
ncbi:unnamed protein product [Brugia timori]|uniref:Uncharacterized protein n=2 Tax=Brugia TaxID=6278 RepID=A0A3P7W8S9_9BILA|nr:unnamed protein product [Brugia timori]